MTEVFDKFVKLHAIENVDASLRKEFASADKQRQREIIVKTYIEHRLYRNGLE